MIQCDIYNQQTKRGAGIVFNIALWYCSGLNEKLCQIYSSALIRKIRLLIECSPHQKNQVDSVHTGGKNHVKTQRGQRAWTQIHHYESGGLPLQKL